MTLRRGSSRGFTLTELLVYMALVTTGLIVFGGIEAGARRSVALQSALIDCELTSQRYLAPLRRDVEDSRSLRVSASKLEVVRLDGSLVIYTQAERVVQDASGKVVARIPFPLATGVEFNRSGQEVRAKLSVSATFGWRDAIKRTYERVASPRVGP